MRFNSQLLKRLRQERGWTQDRAANDLLIDVRTLRAYEGGEVNRGGFRLIRSVQDLLEAMARLYGLPGGVEALLLADDGCRVELNNLSFSHERLYGRDQDLDVLCQARGRGVRLVAVVGWGGMGKSALLAAWLVRLAAAGYPDVDAVFGWRFHQGPGEEAPLSSTDAFFEQALRFFGDSAPHAGSAETRGLRLARLASRQRTLLVLDAVEAVQDPSAECLGHIHDPALRALLLHLAAGPGGCFTLIGSRIWPSDLSTFCLGPVIHHPLPGLSPASGRDLLVGLGVTGAEASLLDAAAEARGHPLTLNLLGRYVMTLGRGDINDRGGLPRLSEGASSVLSGYRRWFETQAGAERAVLWLVSIFGRPAPRRAIDALLSDEALMGALGLSPNAYSNAVFALGQLGLVDDRRIDQMKWLDTHPLIREYFEEHFRATDASTFLRAHSLLFDYFAGSAPDQPETIEEMEPLFIALRHGILADRIVETMELFRRRIGRYPEFYAALQLGAFGLLLEGMSHAFSRPFREIHPKIPATFHANLFAGAGYVLKAMGQTAEAREPLLRSLALHKEAGRWSRAVNKGLNLVELDLLDGSLRQAQRTIAESLEMLKRAIDEPGGPKVLIGMLSTQAVLYHYTGDLKKARALFEQAEEVVRSCVATGPAGRGAQNDPLVYRTWGAGLGARDPSPASTPDIRLRSTWSSWLCDLLIDLGKAEEALSRAEAMTKLRRDRRASPLSIGQSLLGEGRAYLQLGRLSEAAERLIADTGALSYLRRANQRHHLLSGLLAVAELRIRTGTECAAEQVSAFAEALAPLQEAEDIARTAGFRPLLIETLLTRGALFAARLRLLDEKDARGALAAACAEAETLIELTGYHRCTSRLHELLREM